MRAEENDLLCRIGQGTPMGKLMRRYWQPALLSSDLPSPDCPPRHLRLLGEDLVVFRDSGGRIGVLDEACPHRGTSLTLGRVEDGGIKCLFHGWHFAADGTVLERPNTAEPKANVPFKAISYAAHEAGGLIWIYMGPADKRPPFRQFEFMTVPESNRTIVRRDLHCNFLQVLEGGLDSSHVGILHADVSKQGRAAGPRETTTGTPADTAVFNQNNPEIEVRETEFGFDYAAFRSAGAKSGEVNVRVTPFVMPNMVMIPPGTHVIFYIPYDDTHCSWVVAYWSKTKAIDRQSVLKFMGLDIPGVWVNERLMSTRENRYFQDREAMVNGSWSGLAGFTLEDGAMSLSAGAINDRTKEHLVPADVAVMRVRRLFLESIRQVEAGEDPVGLTVSDPMEIKAAEGNVSKASWAQIVAGHKPPRRTPVSA